MKTALLCNGPSRVMYEPSDDYEYVIGCNIPWVRVDSTVIIDAEVLEKWKNPVGFYCSRKAWIDCSNNTKDQLTGYLIKLFDSKPDYDSTGHAACRTLIENGATQIDIYGCDSWFTNTTESYTHQFVDSRSDDMSKHISVWRARWYELMGSNPSIQFNFIGETK